MSTALTQLLTVVSGERSANHGGDQSAPGALFLRLRQPLAPAVVTPESFSTSAPQAAVPPDSAALIQTTALATGTAQSAASSTQPTPPCSHASHFQLQTGSRSTEYVAPEYCSGTEVTCVCLCYPDPEQCNNRLEHANSTVPVNSPNNDDGPSNAASVSTESLFASVLRNVSSTEVSSALEAAQDIFVESVLSQLCTTPETTEWLQQYLRMMGTAVTQIRETLLARLDFVQTCYELRKLCHSISRSDSADDTASKLWCVVRHRIVLSSKRYTTPGDKAHRYFFNRLQRDCNIIAKYRAAGVDRQMLKDLIGASRWTSWVNEVCSFARHVSRVFANECNGNFDRLIELSRSKSLTEMIADVTKPRRSNLTASSTVDIAVEDVGETSSKAQSSINVALDGLPQIAIAQPSSDPTVIPDWSLEQGNQKEVERLVATRSPFINVQQSRAIDSATTATTEMPSCDRHGQKRRQQQQSSVPSSTPSAEQRYVSEEAVDPETQRCLTLSEFFEHYKTLPTGAARLRKVDRRHFMQALDSPTPAFVQNGECEYWLDDETQTMVCVRKHNRGT